MGGRASFFSVSFCTEVYFFKALKIKVDLQKGWRVTAFSKAILLSETQAPCIPSTQAQSPVSLGLSAIETNMKRGVS